MNGYYDNKEPSSFLRPSEMMYKKSCDCKVAVKIKLSEQKYSYFCPDCISKIRCNKNSKNVIHLENFEFDITDIDNFRMQHAIGLMILEMIEDLNAINEHCDERLGTLEIVKEINNKVEQNTNFVKKKILSKYKSYDSFGKPMPIPKH